MERKEPHQLTWELIPFKFSDIGFLIQLWSLLSTLVRSLKDGKLSNDELDQLLDELYKLLDSRVRFKSEVNEVPGDPPATAGSALRHDTL